MVPMCCTMDRICGTVKECPIMTLVRHARIAKCRLVLVGRGTVPGAPSWIRCRSSSRSARRLEVFWFGDERRGTLYAPLRVAAHGLRDQLDPLSDRRVLLHVNAEPVGAEDVEILDGDELLGGRQIQLSRAEARRQSSTGSTSRKARTEEGADSRLWCPAEAAQS